MNKLQGLLKKYTIGRLSQITGISVEVLKRLRQNKIPDHMTVGKDVSLIPSKSVLYSMIKSKLKEHKKLL